MARMVRKQFYITPAQSATLTALARSWGVTESDVIRRAIDQMGQQPPPLTSAEAAWQEELRFMNERAALALADAAQARRWIREDLYEERLGRYPCR